MAFSLKDKIVLDMNDKLAKIDSSLSVGCIGGHDDTIYSMEVSFPQKGNSKWRKQLESIGFQIMRKEKMRDGSFRLRMIYYIHYDKYAIYKTDIGLKATLYIDNYYDLKKYRVFYLGEPTLPMLVNRVGGHCPFDENEKGFLYIKTVLEDEEPLTREEMYPKNSEKFHYGWIAPNGDTYACGFEEHFDCADAICKELSFCGYNAENILEEKGWIKVSRPVPYTPDNRNKQHIYFCGDTYIKGITKQQINTIFDLGLDSDVMVRRQLKIWGEM